LSAKYKSEETKERETCN